MISDEPKIKAGLLEHAPVIEGMFKGTYEITPGRLVEGMFQVSNDAGSVLLTAQTGISFRASGELPCAGRPGSHCLIRNVRIGRTFHWERDEDQLFGGDMVFRAQPDGTLMVINEIELEQYLTCVISSEMNAAAPPEFLRTHAIISRSWLGAMLERKSRNSKLETRNPSTPPSTSSGHRLGASPELIRWYDREEHTEYDVCADDHCQRYHGLTRVVTSAVGDAIRATRGLFLTDGTTICDARYSKSCGGRTENFENVWEPTPVPYLRSIDDSPLGRPPLTTDDDARRWILSQPEAYCNTADEGILKTVLPAFDQETKDYYRWTVRYRREELERLLQEKSGIEFGTLMEIVPLERGTSGRIIRLKIRGTRRTITVGKELEIRRWLSPSHLKSSAFVIETEKGDADVPAAFTFRGAGWGHGVGLCQIGAAVMAAGGAGSDNILHHYYPGTTLRKLYS